MIYRLLRFILRLSLKGFYRGIHIEGIEHIPERGPVLFYSNHSNAFVDPLILLVHLRRPVILTAKSTLIRNPLLAPLIRAAKIELLYRRQDHAEGVDPRANLRALSALVDRLRKGEAVYIFPEGQSHSDPGLRPFRSGAARLILDYLEATEQNTETSDLYILPVGLHFDRKERWRSQAIAWVGAPRSARAWRAEHPQADARALTADLEAWLREITLNTQRQENRQLILQAARLLECAEALPPMLGQEGPWSMAAEIRTAQQVLAGAAELSEREPERLELLRSRVADFSARLDALGLHPSELHLDLGWGPAAFFVLRELELSLVGAPLAAWGWLNHLPALTLVKAIVRRMSSDLDHWATNAVFIAPPVFAIFYVLQTALAFRLLPGAWALLYAGSLPLTGAVALLYRDRLGGAIQRSRSYLRFRARPALREALVEEARQLVAQMRELERKAAE
jgi:1-acyl-sn-glycerol-3-phosphate acyltransferase